jgi:hypothetical protein
MERGDVARMGCVTEREGYRGCMAGIGLLAGLLLSLSELLHAAWGCTTAISQHAGGRCNLGAGGGMVYL